MVKFAASRDAPDVQSERRSLLVVLADSPDDHHGWSMCFEATGSASKRSCFDRHDHATGGVAFLGSQGLESAWGQRGGTSAGSQASKVYFDTKNPSG